MKQAFTLLAISSGLCLQAQITHDLHVLDDEFEPGALTISLGDAVHIIFDDADHTFTQVDQSTWLSNGTVPLPGGYNMGQGTSQPGTDFTITPTALGTIYYVCQIHVAMGMKGTIAVVSTGMEEASMQSAFKLAPTPASSTVEILSDVPGTVLMDIFDTEGRLVISATAQAHTTFDVSVLDAGNYQVNFRDREGVLLSRQRLMVAH